MNLQSHETERFYRIWWALLSYVNAQQHLVPDLPPQPAPGSLNPNDAMKLRNALWAEDSLRERFIAEDPAALPPTDLELVATWKYRVAAKFFVVKHLKKYSVFLDDRDPPRAYGVLGLVSPIENVIGPYLPILVEAVLLPFEDKIIYDSLLTPYRISFGPGIRGNLNTQYRDAQERAGIITSLLPRAEPPTADGAVAAARTRNAKIIGEFRKALYKSGLNPKTVEQHVSQIQSFAETYLLAQEPPRTLLEIQPRDLDKYLRGQDRTEGKTASKSLKRFVRLLWDTGRSDPDTLYALQDFLKSYQREMG
ncbi:MAG: hypothetical protein HY741_09620 [Chloroflexi bacterium]|nr:hypothetical protein [Chloroflexota bacterium]